MISLKFRYELSLLSVRNAEASTGEYPAQSNQRPAIESFAQENGQPVMTHAARQIKLELVPWLRDIHPSGRADPLAGLRAAVSLAPDIVFVLTRSIKRSAGFDAQAYTQQVLMNLDVLNPRSVFGTRPAVIKTIQFLDEDPTGLMQAIAGEHGDGAGSYRVITRVEAGTGAHDPAREALSGTPSESIIAKDAEKP